MPAELLTPEEIQALGDRPWKIGFADGSGCGEDGEGIYITTADEAQDVVVWGGKDSWGLPVGIRHMVVAEVIAAIPHVRMLCQKALGKLDT